MKILVTGATGQIGSELLPELRSRYGKENVIAADINSEKIKAVDEPSEILDILNKENLKDIIEKYHIDTIFHLAAILSARGEKNPRLCFRVNVDGLYNILETALEKEIKKIIIPSSIAVFGPETPDNPAEVTILKPRTIYGISKVLTELLGEHYYEAYGIDIRGVRFPGIISWKTKPGGGATDYAVEVFYEAVENKHYTYFVNKNTILPMMYMPDAVKALVKVSEVEKSRLRYRFYNVSGMSFSAKELTDAIKRFIPEFTAEYKPDDRDKIANTWPSQIDDSAARIDWNWKPEWDMESMCKDMIENLLKRLKR